MARPLPYHLGLAPYQEPAVSQTLDTARYLNLETFRRNGTAVATPVWFAPHGSRAGVFYIFSAQEVGKVKRLRLSPRARVAPCNVRGRVLGEWQTARAYLVDEAEECRNAYADLYRKYGWQMAMTDFFSRLSGRIHKRQIIRIETDQTGNSPST